MNSNKHYFITFLLACLLLNACGASETGPQTWIDIPHDNTTVPLAPIPIMAHASDNNGVESFEFYVNGEFKISIEPRFDDNTRLGWAEWEFTPTRPGVYRIEVSAEDTSSSFGSPATSIITVTDEEEALSPAQAPAAEEPGEEPDLDPVVEALKNANCREGPGTKYGVYGSLLLGEQADIKGRLADNSWFLVDLADRSSNCWIADSIVDVIGDLNTVRVSQIPDLPDEPPAEEPPETQPETPPEEPPPVPPPDEDNNPPTITSVSVSPETIYQNGCSGDVQTTIITVTKMDAVETYKRPSSLWKPLILAE